MLEYQDWPFCRLDEDLIGIVALDGPGNWLASRDKADNNLLALELGDKLRLGLALSWASLFLLPYLSFSRNPSLISFLKVLFLLVLKAPGTYLGLRSLVSCSPFQT